MVRNNDRFDDRLCILQTASNRFSLVTLQRSSSKFPTNLSRTSGK